MSGRYFDLAILDSWLPGRVPCELSQHSTCASISRMPRKLVSSPLHLAKNTKKWVKNAKKYLLWGPQIRFFHRGEIPHILCENLSPGFGIFSPASKWIHTFRASSTSFVYHPGLGEILAKFTKWLLTDSKNVTTFSLSKEVIPRTHRTVFSGW